MAELQRRRRAVRRNHFIAPAAFQNLPRVGVSPKRRNKAIAPCESTAATMRYDDGASATYRDDAVRNPAILARIPAGRWGRPDDLAGAVVFLASKASDYVHGHVLAVDGGWLAR